MTATGKAGDRTLWTICGGSLYASGDGGATWLVSGPENFASLGLTVLAAAVESEALFIGTNASGMYRGRPPYGLPRSTVITPAGGSLYAWDDSLIVKFPAGAFTEAVTVTLTPVNTNPLPWGGNTLFWFFDVNAVNGAGNPVPEVQQSYAMTVTYAGPKIALYEPNIGAFWWNGSAFEPEASSACDPYTNQVTFANTHLDHFSLGVKQKVLLNLYLPLVRR